MTDLISRAEVLYLIDDAWVRGTNLCTADWLVDEIKSLPSAEAVQGWIPCSERLPSEGQGVLVTVDDNKYKIKVGSCLFNNGVFHSLYNDLNVIAWMPLPEPYKGDDDTTGESL